MFYVRWGVVVFLLLVSKATWVPKIQISGVEPDLLLGVSFLFAMGRGMKWGAWSGFVLGLLVDCEQPAHLGVESLALSLAGITVGRLSASLDRGNPLVVLILLFLAALVSESVRTFALAGASDSSAGVLWLRYALPGACYTTVLLPLLLTAAARVLGKRHWMPGAA